MVDETTFQTSSFKKTKTGIHLFDVLLVVLNILAFITMVFFNIASTIPISGLFDQTGADVSDSSEINITPSGWTFITWSVIYVWQGLWLLFNLALVFMTSDYGGPLYKQPFVCTRQFHLFVCANFLLNIAWLFLWDSKHFGISFGVITLMTGTLYAATIISHRNTFEAEPYLISRKPCLWGYRVLLNNGLVFYATWLTIATLLNFAIAWTYEWVDKDNIQTFRETTSIIALSVLSIVLIIYFALENFILEKFLRYTYSSYIQLAIAFAGILSKQWNPKSPSSTAIFTLTLACLVGTMLIFKILFTLYKLIKK